MSRLKLTVPDPAGTFPSARMVVATGAAIIDAIAVIAIVRTIVDGKSHPRTG
jgi:hypothetical protein